MGRLWQDVAQRKMYVTGGIGVQNMRRRLRRRLRTLNDRAYCETCAAIGLALWAHRLNLLHGDAQYADVLERAIYNGILSGIALDGEHFFYVNPLASAGNHHRQPFFGCACCPTNVVRFMPSIPGYVYAIGGRRHFREPLCRGHRQGALGGATVALTQETRYPWDGRVKLRIDPQRTRAGSAIHLRIPGWCKAGRRSPSTAGRWLNRRRKGDYALLRRAWKPGDVVDLDLPMEVQRIEAASGGEGRSRAAWPSSAAPSFIASRRSTTAASVKDIMLPRDPQVHRRASQGPLGRREP